MKPLRNLFWLVRAEGRAFAFGTWSAVCLLAGATLAHWAWR